MTPLCAGMNAAAAPGGAAKGIRVGPRQRSYARPRQYSSIPANQVPWFPVTQRPSFLEFQLSSDPVFWGSVTAPRVSRRS